MLLIVLFILCHVWIKSAWSNWTHLEPFYIHASIAQTVFVLTLNHTHEVCADPTSKFLLIQFKQFFFSSSSLGSTCTPPMNEHNFFLPVPLRVNISEKQKNYLVLLMLQKEWNMKKNSTKYLNFLIIKTLIILKVKSNSGGRWKLIRRSRHVQSKDKCKGTCSLSQILSLNWVNWVLHIIHVTLL